jgi:hypothetical protein
MKIISLFFLITLASCITEPIATFQSVDISGQISIIELYKDSTYVQTFYNNQRESGKWKGSFELDSTLTTFINLDNGTQLGSSIYINENDTLNLLEWSIQ